MIIPPPSFLSNPVEIPLFDVRVETRIKTKIMDARTGRVVKERPFEKNLIFDNILNDWATPGGKTFANFSFVHVGSGTNPVKIASGGVTLSQAATSTVTSSGSFFTAAMVGSLLKWGTGSGGAEVYITVFTNSTTVTVDTVATHVAEVATVWNVQQIALQTELFRSNTFQTISGDCFSTFVNNVITMQRTYVVSQQVSTYNVNEIGWGDSNTATCFGRVVLSSTDVVTPSNFYLVVIQLQITCSPGVPTAVSNVGTNIATAGNAMIERFAIARVSTTGGVDVSDNELDNGGPVGIAFATATYTQRANTTDSAFSPVPTRITINPLARSKNAARGRMDWTINTAITTNGESLFGIYIKNSGSAASPPLFDVKFTVTQTAPVGTFQPNVVFSITYNRSLTN